MTGGGAAARSFAAPVETSGAHTVDDQNPWPGLPAFTEDQQAYFFGRDAEADDLLRHIKRKPLTVLFGKSGLGKTSLLLAGLLPRLRRDGYLPVYVRLDYQDGAPELSVQIKVELARAIEMGDLADQVLPSADETLWEYFHRRDSTLVDRDGKLRSLVLIFDQFEELFTLGEATEAARARCLPLLAEVSDVVENRPPSALEQRLELNPELIGTIAFDRQDYRVLLSLREDYLPQLEDLRERMPSIMENRLRLTQMTGRQAMAVVTKPVADLVPPDVARQIVRFVAGAGVGHPSASAQIEEDLADVKVAPAILSLVCRELNNQRLAHGMAQITAPLLTQNAATIIQDFYERSVADHPPAVRAFIEEELLTESGFRENVALEQARRRLTQRGGPAAALDDLVRRRLLQVEQRHDVQRIELTHDVLTEVIRQSRDLRRQKEDIQLAEQRKAEVRTKLLRRLATFALLAVAVVMAAAATFSSRSNKRAQQQRSIAEQNAQEAQQQRSIAEQNAQETKQQRLIAELNAQEARAAEKSVQQQRLIAEQKTKENEKLFDSMVLDIPRAVLRAKDLPAAQNETLDLLNNYINERLRQNEHESELRARKVIILATRADSEKKLAHDDVAREKLKEALTEANTLRAERSLDFDTQRLLALGFGLIAGTWKELSDPQKARAATHLGLEVISGIVPADDYHAGRRLHTWSLLYQMLGEIEASDKNTKGAQQAYEGMVAKAEEAAALQKEDYELRRSLFDSYVVLGNFHVKQGARASARDAYEKAAALRLDMSGESLEIAKGLAAGFRKLGQAYIDAKDRDGARYAYERALNVRKVLVVSPDQLTRLKYNYNNQDAKQEVAIAHRDIGDLDLELDDAKGAEQAFRESLRLANVLVEESPSVVSYRRTVAYAHEKLGDLRGRGDKPQLAEAEAEYQHAVESLKEAKPLAPKDGDLLRQLASDYDGLASVRLDRKQIGLAVDAYQTSLDIRRQLLKEEESSDNRRRLAATLGNLAFAELFNRRPDLAITYSLEAQSLAPDELWIKTNLAHGYLFTKNPEAEEIYKKYKADKAFNSRDSKTFGEVTLEDFNKLQAAGVTDRDIDRDIERIKGLLTDAKPR